MDVHVPQWSKSFVWDASCGTGNLTQNREFDCLVQTTLFQEDVNILQMGSGGTVTTAQYAAHVFCVLTRQVRLSQRNGMPRVCRVVCEGKSPRGRADQQPSVQDGCELRQQWHVGKNNWCVRDASCTGHEKVSFFKGPAQHSIHVPSVRRPSLLIS